MHRYLLNTPTISHSGCQAAQSVTSQLWGSAHQTNKQINNWEHSLNKVKIHPRKISTACPPIFSFKNKCQFENLRGHRLTFNRLIYLMWHLVFLIAQKNDSKCTVESCRYGATASMWRVFHYMAAMCGKKPRDISNHWRNPLMFVDVQTQPNLQQGDYNSYIHCNRHWSNALWKSCRWGCHPCVAPTVCQTMSLQSMLISVSFAYLSHI